MVGLEAAVVEPIREEVDLEEGLDTAEVESGAVEANQVLVAQAVAVLLEEASAVDMEVVDLESVGMEAVD